MLIVNTASECGFTPQYRGLEDLYRRFRDRSFVVLGCPCNQFGGQEPGSAAEIAAFCERNYGVTFPISEKMNVNGPGTHPLFVWLKQSAPGVLGSTRIKWNFTKFLVDAEGRAVRRYAPRTAPEALSNDIDALLPS